MAVDYKRTIINPALNITLSKKIRKENRFLKPKDLFQLASNAEHYDDLIIFLGLTGLKFGKIAALIVKD